MTDERDARKFDEQTAAAAAACVVHARDLVGAAKAVQAGGYPHIAYHLAGLALEEIGRRELIQVQTISARATVPPTWPNKHTQDHVKKLFWCFFGANFFAEKITGKILDDMNALAKRIHDTRLMGLYVGQDDDGVIVPNATITLEEAETLIALAVARVKMAEGEKLREEIPAEEIELQSWFLKAADDPEKRRQMFSNRSMEKLAELKNGPAWGRWIKELFEKAEADGRAAMELELQRVPPGQGTKEKWKLRIRILCASHSIRPKALTAWNTKMKWIKLVPVSRKTDELIVEFILPNNVPIQALWFFGWGLARQFVVALNIGTMGFWWWRMPKHINRYYESIEDLETHSQLAIERQPSLKVDWGENRVLSEEDLGRVAACFTALPQQSVRDDHTPYNYYIGGITFLSLNDIHWQCEREIFGNFFECLRAMMELSSDWTPPKPFATAFLSFLNDMFPGLEEKDRLVEICGHFENDTISEVQVTLKEATYMKLFCDAYFMRSVIPRQQKKETSGSQAL